MTIVVGKPAVGNSAIPGISHIGLKYNDFDGPDSLGEIKIERSPSMTFTKPGTVKAWNLYSKSTANITLIVVRPVEGNDLKFTIVGMNDLKAPNGKAAVIPVPTADRIRFKAGDIIAWYYWPSPNPTIP